MSEHNYVVSHSSLASVADAIRQKSGLTRYLRFPDEFISVINSISDTSDNYAIFFDYDGAIIDILHKSEINAMTSDSELPANPIHAGLTAQGWNWTLAELKAHFQNNPYQYVVVGQTYITSSGATEIDIELTEGRTEPYLGINVNGDVLIDWGDSSTIEQVTGGSLSSKAFIQHTYAAPGKYTISITKVSGEYTFAGSSSSYLLMKSGNSTDSENRAYATCVRAIRFGEGITQIKSYAFYYCFGLETVTIPNSITSIQGGVFSYNTSLCCMILPKNITTISNYMNSNNHNLSVVSLPSGITSMGDSTYQNCAGLQWICIPYGVTKINASIFNACRSLASMILPDTVTEIGDQAFYECNSIYYIDVPDSVTKIGNGAFYRCYALSNINIPSGVTVINNNTFTNCSLLKYIYLPAGITSIGEYAFTGCTSLQEINIPNSVTTIGRNAFGSCYNLRSLNIPDSVTSMGINVAYYCYNLCEMHLPSNITTIKEQTLSMNYNLSKVTIPSGVTSIETNAIYQCYHLKEIHVLPTTVPQAEASVFTSLPSDCIIYVPQGKLNDYQTASNWAAYASMMQEEPA